MKNINNLMPFLLLKIKPKYVPFYPRSVQIEISTKCNLKCRYCDLPKMDGSYTDKTLSLIDFKRIVDQFPNTRIFKLWGLGEPFLNRDLFEMIKYLKKKKKEVELNTNGMFLTDRNIKKLIDSNLDNIRISIEGINKEMHEALRIKSDFNRIVRNTERLVKLNNKNGKKMKIFIRTILTDKTLKDMNKFRLLLEDIGVNNMIISKYVYSNETHLQDMKLEQITKKMQNKLRNIFKDSKINMITDIDWMINKSGCYWPWTIVYVSIEGDLTPCCFLYDKKYRLGNLFEEDFNKIWNNQNYVQFRKTMKKGYFKVCKDIHCYSQ